MYKRPFLVVGEGIVGPLMALALRQQGLKAHLLQNKSVPSSVDQGSIVLAPDMTDYLTEDLGLSSARPSGSQLKNHYTYDNRGNVLMNLNLDSLKPEESGTFFSCQRSLIEGLLLKECGKGSAYLEYKNPVKVMRAATISSTSSAADGGITAHFDSGATVDYQAVINVSRDMAVVPLSTTHELSVKNREAMVKDHKRAVDVSRLYFEWTFPIPREDWDLTSDELAEIIHRQGRRMWVSATSARNLTVTTTMPAHLRVDDASPSGHSKGLQTYWSTGEPNTHTLWVDALQPAMQKAIAKKEYKRVDYHTPSYCHEHWLEDGGKIIRVGPAAHGATAQVYICCCYCFVALSPSSPYPFPPTT